MITEKNLRIVALLAAMSLFLSTLEYLIPRPVPFMRLGLANLPLLFYLDLLPAPDRRGFSGYLLLIALKVAGQGMVNGTMASYIFLFSLVGSVSSGLIMWVCWFGLRPNISFPGVSVAGALVSNSAQILLSILLIFGPAAWRILPWFLGIGLVSGLVIGIFAGRFTAESRWWRAVKARGETAHER